MGSFFAYTAIASDRWRWKGRRGDIDLKHITSIEDFHKNLPISIKIKGRNKLQDYVSNLLVPL